MIRRLSLSKNPVIFSCPYESQYCIKFIPVKLFRKETMHINNKNKKLNTFRTLSEEFNFFNFSLVLCFLLFLSLSLLFSLTPSIEAAFTKGQGETVTDEGIVIGTGIIIGKNISHAKNRAINNAFLKVIETYLITKLGLQDVADNFQILDEEILSKAKKEIQDYQIVSEFQTDKYVKVLMKVRVNKSLLEQNLESLGLLESDNAKASVLFLVSEKQVGFPPVYWWYEPFSQVSLTQTELSLIRLFEGKGFRIINKSFFTPEEDYDEDMLCITLSNEDAVKWGKLFSSDIVITGDANLYSESWASVFLKALRVTDGVILAQGYREAVLGDNHKDDRSSVGLAIDSWAGDMISYIIKGVEPVKKLANNIDIVLKGLKNYREFIDFKKFLKESFPEIKFVLEKSFKKDAIKLSARVNADSKLFAKKMKEFPEKPFSYEIDKINEQGFTLTIK